MMLPSLFGENLLDDFFDVPAFRGFGMNDPAPRMMSTDIKEVDGGYEISMDLPGFKKENVVGEVKDGYLTVKATIDESKDTKDEKSPERFIRKERYSGSCSRSFYVGNNITEEDIKAKFEDGVLKLYVPKADNKPAVEDKHFIAIEG